MPFPIKVAKVGSPSTNPRCCGQIGLSSKQA